MSKKINLEHLNIAPEAYAAYTEFANRTAQALLSAGMGPESIPDEDVFLENDGSLSIIVSMPGKFETKFSIPARDWTWINYRHFDLLYF